jgi:Ca2+-binding RTX toxin-like protein
VISADTLARLTFGGSASADRMDGTALADVMTGLGGNDTLLGNAGNDRLDGGADNDTLFGGEGTDSLLGGLGNDSLAGDAGDDTLDGGAGADTLSGGSGNNLYRFGRGDGADVISAWDETPTKRNVLELKAGVAQADLRGARVGSDLVLSIAGTADSVTLQSFFDSAAWRPVQEVRLSTGAVVSLDALLQLTFGGSAVADRMEGTALADVMTGLAGNDTLYGNAGNDRLDGGADNDTLFGGEGADSLTGGLGNDSLAGDAGDDTLDGGAGADTLSGGYGNNLYRFGRGDGADVIAAWDETATKRNVLELKAGVAQADLRGARVGSDLVLSIAGTADSVTLQSFFDSAAWRPVQEVRLSTGTVISADTLARLTFGGSASADRMDGTALADVMTGLGGNDTLLGNAGNDRLDGGADNDTLFGGEGADSLLGGLGNDSLAGDAGDDTLDGGAGADTLNGGSGNNTYRFGRGDGADVIEAYDSTPTKRNVLELKAGVAQADLRGVRVGYDLVLSIAGTTDSVTLRNYFDSTSWRPVQEVRLSTGTVLSADTLARLTFGGSASADRMDGPALADVMTGLGGNDSLYGNAGNDSLDGGADNDVLFGGEGNDSLLGGLGNDSLAGDAGDDTLDGGAGVDTLNGGSGNNLYRFGRGDGADVISAYDSITTKRNVLELKAGVAQADLRAARVGYDLVLSIAGTADSVTLQYFFDSAAWRPIQEVRLSTGAVISADTLARLTFGGSASADRMDGTALADVMTGLGGNDTLLGNAGNDSLDGGADNDQLSGGDGADSLTGGLGDDTLQGDAGDDILDGGAGADWLSGGFGRDTYQYGRGDGLDTIRDGGSDGALDTVQFRSGVGLGNLTISRADSGRDLVVALGASDRIVLDDRLVDVNGGADRLRFADGRSLSVEVLVQAMAAFNTPAAGELSLARADVQQYLAPLMGIGA